MQGFFMVSVSCTKVMFPFLIAFSIWYEMSSTLHSKINNISILILLCTVHKKCFEG